MWTRTKAVHKTLVLLRPYDAAEAGVRQTTEPMYERMLLICVPRNVRAKIATMAINARISAYSASP